MQEKERIERKKAIKKARNWFFVLIVFFLIAFIFIIINSGDDETSDYEAETIFKQNYTEIEKEVKGEESEEPINIVPFELLEGEFIGFSYTTWIIGIVFFIIINKVINGFTRRF